MLHNKSKKSLFAFFLILTLIISFTNITLFAKTSEKNKLKDWPAAPDIHGTSAILIDADSNAILYSKNADKVLYPASITKIMTGLVSIENLKLNDTVTYTDDILNALPWDAAKLGLLSGETVSIRDTLYALMLRSANEAAIALSVKCSGSEEAFAKIMTEKAKELGAKNTNFMNATGLHDPNHYTTAYDMALITKGALQNSQFATVWGSENYTLNATNMTESYRIWHRHNLLVSTSEYFYANAIGGKTGYTDEAGRTLVTAAQKDGLRLICVIMQSDDAHIFSDTTALFEYGFNHFNKVSVQEDETRFGSTSDAIPVLRKLYGKDSGIFSLTNDSILIPSSVSLSDIPYTIKYLETPENNVIAKITYEYNGNYLGETSLLMTLSETPNNSLTGPRKNIETNPSASTLQESVSINIYLLAGSVIGMLLFILIGIKIWKYRKKVAERKKRRTYYKF